MATLTKKKSYKDSENTKNDLITHIRLEKILVLCLLSVVCCLFSICYCLLKIAKVHLIYIFIIPILPFMLA